MADDKNQDEDNFGLPDIEYKPLEQLDTPKPAEEPVKESQTSSYQSEPSNESRSYYEEEEEEESKSGVVITLIVGLIILAGGFLAYKYIWVPKKEKARLAKLAEDQKQAKEKATADSLARVAEQDRLKREAEANAKPAEGAIETLSARTGHYFVVVSSSVDGDLAMDRARKLSATGTSCKIIPPYGKWKYYRLCVGDFDSFASAQSNADASKSQYGEGLWVIKY